MKSIANSYQLPNKNDIIDNDSLRRALDDFEFFMSNYQQITNKERKVVPFKLNAFQRMLFSTLLPMVRKGTRLDKRHQVVVVKGRQVGASVSIVALINYICAYVDGMENLSIAHTFPVADTISKFYNKKVEPIISGVHPDLYPNIERETLGSSIMTRYNDIKGIRRNNYYELISAGASSIRSDTINVLLQDEVCFYAHPEVLEDAIMPALPDYGFSLVVYLSTVTDKKSEFFQHKLRVAMENPEDWTVIFAPWYLSYPERESNIDYHDLEPFTEYELDVIFPALVKDNVPKERWGDCIDWYRRKSSAVPNMKMEFPTTLEEVLAIGEDISVFPREHIERQRESMETGHYYDLYQNTQTQEIKAVMSEKETPLKIFEQPIYGHQYRLVVDPITAVSDDSDFFAMSMFDTKSHKQVATFRAKGMTTEDYADYAVNMATIYNKAQICPEINVAGGFVACVNNLRYYNWYYESQKNRKDRLPGIRTSVATKNNMIEKLQVMLLKNTIKINDPVWLDELGDFVKHQTRSGGIRMAAKKGKHDDTVATLFVYAGSLDDREIDGHKRSGFAIL